MTILWDIDEKSAKLTEKNLQVDNYKVDFNDFWDFPTKKILA